MDKVIVYGTTGSVATWDIRRLLERIQVPYCFVDLECNEDAANLLRHMLPQKVGDHMTCVPVVFLPDEGKLLVNAARHQIATKFGVRLDTGVLSKLALMQHCPPQASSDE